VNSKLSDPDREGPPTECAISRYRGTIKRCRLADRRCRQPTSATGVQHAVDQIGPTLVLCRDLHGNGDDGNPAGMEANVAGVPREWTYNLAGLLRECLFILLYNVSL